MPTAQLYGAIVISAIVCITFTLALYEAYTKGDQHTVDMLIGAIIATFTATVQYWIGSSMGSQKKDALLLAAQPPTPANINIPPPPIENVVPPAKAVDKP